MSKSVTARRDATPTRAAHCANPPGGRETTHRPGRASKPRAGGVRESNTPPCWANPEAWFIDITLGLELAAEMIREAEHGCRRCSYASPAQYAACAAVPPKLRSPRMVMAGKVITNAGEPIDPERYIRGPLRNLKPRPGDEASGR